MLVNKAGLLAVLALSTNALAQWEDYSQTDLYSRGADIDYDSYLQGYISGLARRQDDKAKADAEKAKKEADSNKADAGKLSEAKNANKQAKKDSKIMKQDKTKLKANDKKLEDVRSQIKTLRADKEKNKDDKAKSDEIDTKIKTLSDQKKTLKEEKEKLEKHYQDTKADKKVQQAIVEKDLARRSLLEEYLEWDGWM